MESKFLKLRKVLDEMGYYQTLHPESIILVERLAADLKTTTESLNKYIKIAQQAIEERDNLQLGAEPYKCDNAKLVKECNDLHLAFLHYKEEQDKKQKELRNIISTLEEEKSSIECDKQKLKNRVFELESELVDQGNVLRNFQDKKTLTGSNHHLPKGSKSKSKNFEINSVMACADEKIVLLHKEIKNLKEGQIKLLENNEMLQGQIASRDKEIKRITDLLEGGRPVNALNKDCCYKNVDNRLLGLQDELTNMRREKNSLQNNLKDALAKQHEAMRRALHLAERNKQLEKELNDIDQIALAVEAECNSTVKVNAEKVCRLQDKVNESLITIQNLERDNARLKQDTNELLSELDSVKLEKKHLQQLLENESGERKRLTDRINGFSIIEHDLNIEIDRLVRLSSEQKRKIADLECQISNCKIKICDEPEKGDKSTKFDYSGKSSAGKNPQYSAKSLKSSLKDIENISVQTGRCYNGCCEAGTCVKHFRDLLDKEIEFRQNQATQCIENLRQEKEYYMRQYHKIMEQLKNSGGITDNYPDLKQKLDERETIISNLEVANRNLSKEKFDLITKLDGSRELMNEDLDTKCSKSCCKRREREIDIYRDDIQQLQEENDLLKRKIQSVNEKATIDQQRMKSAFAELEDHIKKLEDERRDLVKSQTSRTATLSHVEEQCDVIKQQLQNSQMELNNQKTTYNQLKQIHDHTSQALSDTQNKLLEAESELANYRLKLKTSDVESSVYEKQISALQNDVQIMKVQLSKMDKEKDELLIAVDSKTERIALLEDELKIKCRTISHLESQLGEQKKKLSKVMEESNSNEDVLRSARRELGSIQQDLDNERRSRESLVRENKRLQDDLSSVTCDCRDARNELECAQRQIEDLKRQLQHYVAEVKRTEDLISQKELERSEILDQFKCLSQEANALESNNHTLETEASQSKMQLSIALDHASDLELKLENRDSIIRSYEKQIADLTSQVASLEIQMRQGSSQQDRFESELKTTRDLCVKLDEEKEQLRKELATRNDYKSQVDRNLDRLRSEKESLQNALSKDRNTLEGLEKLLNESRQEVIEQRLLNQSLQEEVMRLKQRVAELQDRHAVATEQLDMYQEKALEYSQQNKQLRREVANERFFRAREDDNKRYPSL